MHIINNSEAGQALASRPDLLPSEYLDELQQLQDNVPTFGNDIAFHIVEEELKQKFGDVFELVEPEPIAGELFLLPLPLSLSFPNECCVDLINRCFSLACTSIISGKHRPSLQM